MTKRSMELLVWSLIILGLGAIVLGIYAVVATPTQVNSNVETLATPVTASEQKQGSEAAKVTLVEYSDFQCPACKYFYGMTKQLKQEKGDQVQFVFRHFPLTQIHKNALPAALAAEAAGKQGKFWEMHDILFEKQEEWSANENITQSVGIYAAQLGLNIGQFQLDMQSLELADKVRRSMEEGNAQGIQGTPTFYLNGKMIKIQSYEELKSAVESELSK
jgi:protein-disulfide isomerase